MVGALFAAATAAGIPQYGRSLEIVSMRATVADTGPYNTNVHISTSWVPLTESDRVRSDQTVLTAVDSYLGDLVIDSVRLTKSRLHWWAQLGEPLRTDDDASQATFQYIERLDEHVEYVKGVAPTDSKTEIDGKTVGVYDYSFKRRRDYVIEDESVRNKAMVKVHDPARAHPPTISSGLRTPHSLFEGLQFLEVGPAQHPVRMAHPTPTSVLPPATACLWLE